MGNSNVIVEMKNISKRFGGTQALNCVNFSAIAGEVHAIMGENGAGKSTLIKILSGVHNRDSGEIFIEFEKINNMNTIISRDKGVSVIYQEFALFPDLTVAENIFIDSLNDGKLLINWRNLEEKAKKLLSDLGFDDIDVLQSVSNLTVAYQQVVEICKALTRDSKILVLDEPTAVLTLKETEKLFEIIRLLKEKNVCIIYVSHRLEEIFEISDRVTVLKDGKHVDTVNTKEIAEQDLIRMMIGRNMENFFPERNITIGKELLRVEGLSRDNHVKEVSFKVHAGEVLGVSGLVGAGRTETARLIFGADKLDSGNIYIDNQLVRINNPKDAIKKGIGLLAEDRKKHGVILDLPVKHNGTLTIIERISKVFSFIMKKEEEKLVYDIIRKLNIKVGSIYDNVDTLSGGNQQKVSLMKWIASNSKILILDEPTRGVDVGAKTEIYKVINKLASDGVAILMISSEMPEIIGMCDRVLVMFQGKIAGELSGNEINEINIINYAMGVSNDE